MLVENLSHAGPDTMRSVQLTAPLSHIRKVNPLGHSDEQIYLHVADEVPVTVVFNDVVPHGVMMMTPDHLVDFAFGYCLTEQIVHSADQIRSVNVSDSKDGLTINITIAGDSLSALLRRKPRMQTGHSSCGICGSGNVPAVDIVGQSSFPIRETVAPAAILRALRDLDQWQKLNAITHMVHGAAWADLNGQIYLIREDVGRHNALDKLIGAQMRSKTLREGGICLLTSRYSYEMALKTARAGMHTIVSVSAPTDRALQLAETMNQTLIAIARHDRQFVFCGWQRLETK